MIYNTLLNNSPNHLKVNTMKKVVLTLAVLLMLVVLIGADIRGRDTTTSATALKKFCKGYTIIEFGKAIDCNGDTLRLVKVHGGQQVLKDQREPS